jgi:hypothetical protein
VRNVSELASEHQGHSDSSSALSERDTQARRMIGPTR